MKRTIAFFDGQSLFHAVRNTFGYRIPNFDIYELAQTICKEHSWQLIQVRFYTGVPSRGRNEKWHQFWRNKLRTAKSEHGVKGITTELREHQKTLRVYIPDLFPDDKVWQNISRRFDEWVKYDYYDSDEKGIDVRIAVDVIRLALKKEFDVALIFSQDQDLAEVAREIPVIAREQDRWIHTASAYPYSDDTENPRGIDNTTWIKIDKTTYDKCIDLRDYFGKKEQKEFKFE